MVLCKGAFYPVTGDTEIWLQTKRHKPGSRFRKRPGYRFRQTFDYRFEETSDYRFEKESDFRFGMVPRETLPMGLYPWIEQPTIA